jgi:hypothetical protein
LRRGVDARPPLISGIDHRGSTVAAKAVAAKALLMVHNSGKGMCNRRVTAQYYIRTILIANTRGNTR